MKKVLKEILKNDKGYGVVELLIIIAALGLLASSMMRGLDKALIGTTDEPGATGVVGKKIIENIEQW